MTARPALVGGFILGALALAVVAILLFSGMRLFTKTSHAVVIFEGSIAGLTVGAPVTFRGVPVGSVERIELNISAASLDAHIPVFLKLEPDSITWTDKDMKGKKVDYQKLIEIGLRAQLVSQSFVTGQMRVDLDFHPGTPAPEIGIIGGVPEIPAMPSEMEKLKDTLKDVPLRELAQSAQHTLATVDQLAAHLNASVDPLIESTRKAADTATHTLQTASVTLASMNTFAVDAQRQLDARSADLGHTLAKTDNVASQAETILTSLNDLTAPRSQFRGDLEVTARDLAASASSLRAFARDLERNPSAILTGKTNP